MRVLTARLDGFIRGPRFRLCCVFALALAIGLCPSADLIATDVDLGQMTPRPPQSDADLKAWLENMIVHHGFSTAEVTAATGLSDAEVREAVRGFGLDKPTGTEAVSPGQVKVLPYPGGRHPRGSPLHSRKRKTFALSIHAVPPTGGRRPRGSPLHSRKAQDVCVEHPCHAPHRRQTSARFAISQPQHARRLR